MMVMVLVMGNKDGDVDETMLVTMMIMMTVMIITTSRVVRMIMTMMMELNTYQRGVWNIIIKKLHNRAIFLDSQRLIVFSIHINPIRIWIWTDIQEQLSTRTSAHVERGVDHI